LNSDFILTSGYAKIVLFRANSSDPATGYKPAGAS